MINRITPLPYWHVPHLRPAVHDLESMSVLEQTGKLYASIQELISDYNKMALDVNKNIEEFISGVNTDQTEFENYITKLVHDYIAMLDEKVKSLENGIDVNIEEIKTELQNYVDERFNAEIVEVLGGDY